MLAPMFAWMVDHLDPAAASAAYARMREVLHAHETTDGVAIDSAAWLITARPRHEQ
jgi:hypothetical protein